MHVTGNLTRHISPVEAHRFRGARKCRFGRLRIGFIARSGSGSVRSGRRTRSANRFRLLALPKAARLSDFSLSGRNPSDLDLPVVLAVRVAVFQLRYLERVPAHAAVHESVEFVKWRKRSSAANFTNAVLRKVNRKAVPWPDTGTELSCPDWLLERWSSHFDQQTALRIAAAALTEPELYLRIPPGSPLPAGIQTEETEIPGEHIVCSQQRRPGFGFMISVPKPSCRCSICGRAIPTWICVLPLVTRRSRRSINTPGSRRGLRYQRKADRRYTAGLSARVA